MSYERIPVMQVIGTLEIGGAERMALNLANLLPRERYIMHLCTLRGEGPLISELYPDVNYFALSRSSRFSDPYAVWKLARYIRHHNIRILHCHNYTIFLCALAALLCPSVAIVWHDHNSPDKRAKLLYRFATRSTRAVLAVSDQLANWAINALGFEESHVHVVRNFVVTSPSPKTPPNLPVREGCRIVLVANLYWAKGILSFVQAMARVAAEVPTVQAILVGGAPDSEYLESVMKEIDQHNLSDQVFLLGERNDVAAILSQSDIGVLSSVSEGLPLALIEYGMAGLATVATRVGQCADVIDDGRLGLLVPPDDPDVLGDAILRLVKSETERQRLGREFQLATERRYSPDQTLKEITRIYDNLLDV